MIIPAAGPYPDLTGDLPWDYQFSAEDYSGCCCEHWYP